MSLDFGAMFCLIDLEEPTESTVFPTEFRGASCIRPFSSIFSAAAQRAQH